MYLHTALVNMPRRARVRVGDRRRREYLRNYYREQRQHQAEQCNHDAPVDAAVNELDELQLQHSPAHDPVVLEAEHLILPEGEGMIDDEPIQLPAPHSLRDMNNRCPHCRARYFQEECTTWRISTKCCFQGKVSLPPIQLPSQNVVELFSGSTAQSRHFLEKIRHYNATMAMASWNAALTEHAGRGPRVVTIHGQAYHLTAAKEAPEGRPAQYAQLYILDANDALQQRVNNPRNENLQADIIQLLQDDLLAVNPYARQYQNMGQSHQRERQLAAANNEPAPPIRMVIAQRPFQDRRYADPTATEIAAVYGGNDGAAPNPSDRDLEVHFCYSVRIVIFLAYFSNSSSSNWKVSCLESRICKMQLPFTTVNYSLKSLFVNILYRTHSTTPNLLFTHTFFIDIHVNVIIYRYSVLYRTHSTTPNLLFTHTFFIHIHVNVIIYRYSFHFALYLSTTYL